MHSGVKSEPLFHSKCFATGLADKPRSSGLLVLLLLLRVFPRMFLLVIFSNESLLAPSAGELLLRSIFSGGIFLLCVLSCG